MVAVALGLVGDGGTVGREIPPSPSECLPLGDRLAAPHRGYHLLGEERVAQLLLRVPPRHRRPSRALLGRQLAGLDRLLLPLHGEARHVQRGGDGVDAGDGAGLVLRSDQAGEAAPSTQARTRAIGG